MMYNGAAVATLVMDGDGALVTQPQVTVMGLIEGPEAGEILVEVGFAVREAVEDFRCRPGLTTRRYGKLPGSPSAAVSMRARQKAAH